MAVITVQNVSKVYRTGQYGYRTLREDLYDLTGRLISLTGKGKAHSYKKHVWALKDVSFQVEEGEKLGIIGPNGSGKTTLLRLLAGITKPTEGSISLKGRLGVLIELMAGFHPELTGRENVYLNGAIMGMSRKEIRRKFDEIVSFAEVEDYIDTPIKRYSSGMNVRLGFAVAAHLDPDILLVDEVLAVGDAAFQKKCVGKMGAAAQEGRTVMFVSHNMASVESLCDSAILLESGRLVKQGPTDDVVEAYLRRKEELTVGDLAVRSDRKGDGRIRFTSVRFLDGEGRETGVVRSGQTLRIAIDFVSTEKGVGAEGLKVSVSINSLLGENLLLCSSALSGDDLGPVPPEGRVVCEIPRLPLTGGTYSLNLYSDVNGVIADFIIDVVQLQVESGDFFGSGCLPPTTHTKFLVEHSWRSE